MVRIVILIGTWLRPTNPPPHAIIHLSPPAYGAQTVMTTPATPATTASDLAAPFVLKLTASGETLLDIETTLERILVLLRMVMMVEMAATGLPGNLAGV